MKKILSILLAALMLASLLTFVSCDGLNFGNSDTEAESETDENGNVIVPEKKYTVGVVQLVQHEALDAATQGFIDTLKAELGEKNVTVLNENASNDPNACTTIVNNFVNKKVDLIMANATPALQAAVNGTDKIPVLGTSITEYGVALGIDNFDGLVGGNVSGTSDLAPLDQQAKMLVDLFPEAEKVALLYCSSEPNSKYQVEEIRRQLVYLGLSDTNIRDFAFTDSNDVNGQAAAAAAFADVIYIPTDNTAASCSETINGVIGDTPVIAGEQGICKGCGVATLSIDYYDLGVATGKMAAKILKGEAKIEEMKIEYSAEFTKMYNKDKCEELGIPTADLDAKEYTPIQ